jgi:hypothetical protein
MIIEEIKKDWGSPNAPTVTLDNNLNLVVSPLGDTFFC